MNEQLNISSKNVGMEDESLKDELWILMTTINQMNPHQMIQKVTEKLNIKQFDICIKKEKLIKTMSHKVNENWKKITFLKSFLHLFAQQKLTISWSYCYDLVQLDLDLFTNHMSLQDTMHWGTCSIILPLHHWHATQKWDLYFSSKTYNISFYWSILCTCWQNLRI